MSAPDASVALQVTPEPWTSAAFELRVLRYAARGQTSSSGFSVDTTPDSKLMHFPTSLRPTESTQPG